MIERVISGGQTGADQGGLYAAKAAGLMTGGWMPKGFKTEDGPRPDFADLFGIKEHPSPEYPPRTHANVRDSDATVWFGRGDSRGFACTEKATRTGKVWKPFCAIVTRSITPARFAIWLQGFGVKTLNVAGNRESMSPGIRSRVEEYLADVFRILSDDDEPNHSGSGDVSGAGSRAGT